jgi:hypothetical protein
MKVLCCVLIFGRIATAHVPAFEAQTQMDPAIASFEALFANVFVCGSKPDSVYMRTLGHNLPPMDSFVAWRHCKDNLNRRSTGGP